MGLKQWIIDRLSQTPTAAKEVAAADFFDLAANCYIQDLAFWSCVTVISNAITKCRFKTYVGGKEIKGDEYYLWNYEPNCNQNANEFLDELIAKLYKDNEALVVEASGQLIVAESYTKTEYALKENLFSNVSAKNLSFSRSFRQSEVLYFQLNAENMKRISDGVYGAYSELLMYCMNSYKKSRGRSGILKIDAMVQNSQGFQDRYDNLINEQFKKYFQADNAVLPLFSGFDFQEDKSKTYSNESTRDIKAMIDDICEWTAKAFGVPPAAVSGNITNTKEAIDQMLTFCIDPLVAMIETEINRKRYGKEGIQNGSYIKIDTTAIKHIDLLDVAASIDKLISSGAFCIDDIREAVGKDPLNTEWSREHFITKNYSSIEELLNALEGGKT